MNTAGRAEADRAVTALHTMVRSLALCIPVWRALWRYALLYGGTHLRYAFPCA